MFFREAGVWGAWLQRVSSRGPVCLNRALSWILGRSYGLRGLEDIVADADIVHASETHFTTTYQCLRLKGLYKRLVATVWENIPGQGETHPWRRRRKRLAKSGIDGFLAVTETTRRMLLEEGVPDSRIAVIPMAVDLDRFRPSGKDPGLLQELGVSDSDVVVLFVGRLVREKGVEDILAAAPRILEKTNGRARFVFVGSGPLSVKIRRAAQSLKRAVIIRDFVAYDKIPALHNLADVFVLPSRPARKWQEQFGYVLVESMACGRAVVTTKTGSIPDVVGDAARLVAPADPRALADEVVALALSSAEREALGERARRRAEAVFSAEKIAPAIERFYEDVLKRPRAGEVA
ncbi:MAG: glycosyltransferase family 4 protein [Elusimicrobiota bacterium]